MVGGKSSWEHYDRQEFLTTTNGNVVNIDASVWEYRGSAAENYFLCNADKVWLLRCKEHIHDIAIHVNACSSHIMLIFCVVSV